MKIVSNITRMLLAGALALSLGTALVQPASASVCKHGSTVTLFWGDGQETHGGPHRHATPVSAPLFWGDGQETHGGPH
jgi:hypothetical protein